MSVVLVQAKITTASALSDGSTLAFDAPVTVGNHVLIVCEHSYFSCTPSIDDSLGNAYTRKGTGADIAGDGFYRAWAFQAPITVGGSLTITAHMACGSLRVFAMMEVSGLVTDPFDQMVTHASASSPLDSGALTPVQDGCYLTALMNTRGVGVSLTASAPFTKQLENALPDAALLDYLQATAANISAQATYAGGATPSANMIVSWKALPIEAPTGPNPFFTTLHSFQRRAA